MDEILNTFPFRCVLSLKPLVDYLDKSLTLETSCTRRCLKDDLMDMVRQAPDLLDPIEDHAVLEQQSDLVQRLMSMVFPPVSWETEAVAALVPFSMKPIFVSPNFQRLFLGEDGTFLGRRNLDEESFNRGRAIRAYLHILGKFYDIHQYFQ